MKIHPVGAELFQEGRRHMTKLIIAFRSFATAPNYSISQHSCSSTNYSPYQHKVFFRNFIKRAHINACNIYLAHDPLRAPFLMPQLGERSDTSVTYFPLYKISRNKYGCRAIMERLKICVYSGQKIPWKKRSICLHELQVRTIKAKLKVVSGPLPTYFSSATTVKYT